MNLLLVRILMGSSPRMRGTRLRRGEDQHAGGIIPADAGNTFDSLRGYKAKGDHPRGCGEHWRVRTGTISGWGSSPRMRGTLEKTVQIAFRNGIIPADAGNTERCPSRLLCRTDHPRGCGEHCFVIKLDHPNIGSSPRMRGTPGHRPQIHSADRIIPADAGNTQSCISRTSPDTDHPRGCGEHVQVPVAVMPDAGSSPRMRGTP